MDNSVERILSEIQEVGSRDRAVRDLKAMGPEAVPLIVRAYGGKNRKMQEACRMAISELGKAALAKLLPMAQSTDREERYCAISLLSKFPSEDKKLYKALYENVIEPLNTKAGRAAFQALLRRGDNAIPYLARAAGFCTKLHSFIDQVIIVETFGKKLIPELYQILEQELEIYESEGPSRLFWRFDPEVVPPLIEWLEEKHMRPCVVAAAIDSLAIGGCPRELEDVRNRVPIHHRMALRSAIGTLPDYRYSKTVDATKLACVHGMLASNDYRRQLAGLLCAGNSKNPEFIGEVEGYLIAEDEGLLCVALTALGTIVADKTLIPMRMLALLRSDNLIIRATAVNAFRIMREWHHVEIPASAGKAVDLSKEEANRLLIEKLEKLSEEAREADLWDESAND